MAMAIWMVGGPWQVGIHCKPFNYSSSSSQFANCSNILDGMYLFIYMFSDVGKISWNSIKSNSMQMNTCTNYACGVAWSPKFATYAKSSVLLCQFLLLNPIYASFSNNPFSVDNLFVGTDSTSWIWLRLSLIRFSTFQ